MSPALRWGLIGASDIAASRVKPAMRELGQAQAVAARRLHNARKASVHAQNRTFGAPPSTQPSELPTAPSRQGGCG
jgi:predicted dehydrogenase